MGFIELADVAYALPGRLDAVRGGELPRARGRARRSRRRERHRQVHAAPPDRGRRPPDRGLDPDRRTGRADAAVHRVRGAPDDGPRLPPRVRRTTCLGGGDPRRQGRALDARSPGRTGADALRGRARELGRGRRVRGRGAVRPVHARGVRTGLPRVRRTQDRDALGRRTQAPRARGDPAVAVRHRDARRARQRARHRGQAVARGRDRGQPQDRPVREPRPDRARSRRDQDRHARGTSGVDAPRRVLELRRARATPGSTGWTRTTAGTRRSTVGSRRW